MIQLAFISYLLSGLPKILTFSILSKDLSRPSIFVRDDIFKIVKVKIERSKMGKRVKLMKAIDDTNIKYGRHALSIAQAGFKKKWNTRRQHDSKIDTASFQLLPIVRA